MKACMAILILLGMTSIAFGSENPSSQWKLSRLSLAELVSGGYKIVAVTNDNVANDTWGTTYYLQNKSSAYKCSETHLLDIKKGIHNDVFMCWSLVKPYQYHIKGM